MVNRGSREVSGGKKRSMKVREVNGGKCWSMKGQWRSVEVKRGQERAMEVNRGQEGHGGSMDVNGSESWPTEVSGGETRSMKVKGCPRW